MVFYVFPTLLEIYKEENVITNIDVDYAKLLLHNFWEKDIIAIASCDFEDLLPEKGGYNSSNLKW